jgi:hypothetical protein
MTGDQSRHLKVGDRVCWGATMNQGDLKPKVANFYPVGREQVKKVEVDLVPDDFGDPHFGPKQVCAGALCAGCQ